MNETRNNWNGKDNCKEEISRNTSRDKPVFERQQNNNKQEDSRDDRYTIDTTRTLLQDGQIKGNTKSEDMEKVKMDIKTGQSVRQASDGILREGSRIRDDEESLQSRENKPNISNIRYFSMFTGVGGFELGLKAANDNQSKTKGLQTETYSPSNITEPLQRTTFSCVGMSEWDKYSSQVLKYQFPNIKNWGDCTKIRPEDLPDFDMLCGGFPCQAFSIAGKRRGFEDTRGTMFFEVARILKVKRPKIVLLENVKGLLNHNKGETFRVIIQTLDELGYEVQWMVLNSKFFGVPQNRERVLIIGSLRGTGRPEILPFGETSQQLNERNAAEQIASSLQHPGHSGGNYKGMNMVKAVLTPDRANKRQNGRRFKEYGEPSFTITGQDIHGIMEVANCVTPDGYLQSGKRKRVDGKAVLTSAHERRIRRLTPIECERLQGFPDNWTEWGINEKGEKVKMSDTQRYKQMGNAVTTNVIRAVGSKL